MTEFDYHNAFSRNLGIVSSDEHVRLCQSTVAIAGMGGVGGDYLISLVRAGVGRFHIAEFDEFELANFNRQYGANIRTLGRRKIEVMLEYALEINPDLDVKIFDKGLNAGNIDEFTRPYADQPVPVGDDQFQHGYRRLGHRKDRHYTGVGAGVYLRAAIHHHLRYPGAALPQ